MVTEGFRVLARLALWSVPTPRPHWLALTLGFSQLDTVLYAWGVDGPTIGSVKLSQVPPSSGAEATWAARGKLATVASRPDRVEHGSRFDDAAADGARYGRSPSNQVRHESNALAWQVRCPSVGRLPKLQVCSGEASSVWQSV